MLERIWERKDMGDVSPVGQGRAQRVTEDTWPRIRRLFSSPDNALTKHVLSDMRSPSD